jgi:putative transposase
MIAINGTRNHIHLLIDVKPFQALSELVREVKKSSTSFVNDMKLTSNHFQWQNGFGAFAVYRQDRKIVIDYIENQKIHHQKKSFKEEFHELLRENEIEFKDEYLFEWI